MKLSVAWQLVYWLWVASEVILVFVTRTRRKTGEIRDRGSLLILWPVIFCSIWFAFDYGARHAHTMFHDASWLLPLSFVLLLVGIAIRWTAIASLGRSFSVNVAIHATQTLYRGGLYRFVRHPSYTGMLFIFLAIGLSSRNWIALAVMVICPTLALIYRIHVEEQALRGAFGEEYETYCHSTARLVPGLY
jgi:protein-S-isoprenylcysteine O-methyltransferase Ste14